MFLHTKKRHEGFLDRQTHEEGRRAKRPKRCDNKNKDGDIRYPFITWDKGSAHLVKIQSFSSEIGVTSPGRRPEGWYMVAISRLDYMPHISVVLRSKEIQDITFGIGLAAGVTGKLSEVKVNLHRGSILSFLSGFISMAFSVFWRWPQDSGGLQSGFSFLSSSVCPKELVMRHQLFTFVHSPAPSRT